jgi:hypothetical protein
VPQAVKSALEQIFLAPVEQVKVIEHSWLTRLHGRAVATTRAQRIYLRGSATPFFLDPWLMLHEYCHVIRQWQPGRLTVPGYLYECLKRGYRNNRFEIEARAFADENTTRLHALLGLRPGHSRPGF